MEESDEEGSNYRYLRTMNEYINGNSLINLNDVNHFAKKMQDSKEDETMLDGEHLKEKVVDEYNNFLGENTFKEKNNEYFDLNPFNFNPNEKTYNKYKEEDFNSSDNYSNNDNILQKFFK